MSRGPSISLAAAMFFVALLFAAQSSAGAIEIRHVAHAPSELDPHAEDSVRVGFELSNDASVLLTIFDGRNIEIRSVSSDALLAAGRHELQWDGTDFAGRPVPPEAYSFTLSATTASGEQTSWDATDRTGGKNIRLHSATWDPTAGQIQYELSEPSRVRIRIGLKGNGPLLGTIVDWVARGAGSHAEAWDGKDVAGILDLSNHPQLAIDAQAIALSDNAIVVGPVSHVISFVQDVPDAAARRERQGRRRKRMYDYAARPIAQRRDFQAELELVGAPNRDGVAIAEGSVPVRLTVSPGDQEMLRLDRFEAVFFVDGRYVFETEAAFFPLTWQWDVSSLNPGDHYLTANLRGYEGFFGITTLKVRVE